MDLSSPSSPTSLKKRPFAFLEHSVIQFNEVLIPHRLDMLKKHKINIKKCLQLKDYQGASKEQAVASILIQNLSRDLMDMEALRNQVQDVDRYQFDQATVKSKERALQAIREFMSNNPGVSCGEHSQFQAENEEDDSGYMTGPVNVLADAPQIFLEKSKEGVLNSDEEAYIQSCEKLKADIEDLNDTFLSLQQLVKDQEELLGSVEGNVEAAKEQVCAGNKNLLKAVSYKSIKYPLFGAALGTLIGGPIGLLVGLKTGAGLAVGGSVIGYVGGKVLRKKATENVKKNEEERKEA